MKLVRRSDIEGTGPRRQDQVEIFVRFVRTPSGSWVAESDAPPLRAEAASIGEARRILASRLAVRMGSGCLESATVILDLPEDEAGGEPDADLDDDGWAGDEDA